MDPAYEYDADDVQMLLEYSWQGNSEGVEHICRYCPGIASAVHPERPEICALVYAVEYANPGTTRVLLDAGASTTTLGGSNALIKAVDAKDEKMVALLLTRGACPNAVGPTGVAAIHEAVINSCSEGIYCSDRAISMLQLLLGHGADPNCKPDPAMVVEGWGFGPRKYGLPIQLAAAWGREDIAARLAICGADVQSALPAEPGNIYRAQGEMMLGGIRNRPLGAIAAQFGLGTELADAIRNGAHAGWCPKRYSTYQEHMGAVIKTLLLVQHRLKALEETGMVAIPREMWTLIHGFMLPRHWASVVEYSKPT